jgi:hypothetical protein
MRPTRLMSSSWPSSPEADGQESVPPGQRSDSAPEEPFVLSFSTTRQTLLLVGAAGQFTRTLVARLLALHTRRFEHHEYLARLAQSSANERGVYQDGSWWDVDVVDSARWSVWRPGGDAPHVLASTFHVSWASGVDADGKDFSMCQSAEVKANISQASTRTATCSFKLGSSQLSTHRYFISSGPIQGSSF